MIRRLIFSILISFIGFSVYAAPLAKVTMRVVDERGQPVSGAEGSFGFMSGARENNVVRGITDEKGMLSGESSEIDSYVALNVKKDGYYNSRVRPKLYTHFSGLYGFRRWQPWNPTIDVVMKPIKNPIPMYAYYTDWITIPKLDEYIGYDLIKHDWVMPYGSGTTSDFLFKLTKDMRIKNKYNQWRDYDVWLDLKFTNNEDGIQSKVIGKEQGSEYKMDYQAPLNYQKQSTQHQYGRANEISKIRYKEGQNYYFRVRSQGDGQGNLEKGLYGKIHGDIEFVGGFQKTGKIRFTYYLNPTHLDRNIEFDPQRNLFKGLERIFAP